MTKSLRPPKSSQSVENPQMKVAAGSLSSCQMLDQDILYASFTGQIAAVVELEGAFDTSVHLACQRGYLPARCSRSPPTTPRAPCARAARHDIHICGLCGFGGRTPRGYCAARAHDARGVVGGEREQRAGKYPRLHAKCTLVSKAPSRLVRIVS